MKVLFRGIMEYRVMESAQGEQKTTGSPTADITTLPHTPAEALEMVEAEEGKVLARGGPRRIQRDCLHPIHRASEMALAILGRFYSLVELGQLLLALGGFVGPVS